MNEDVEHMARAIETMGRGLPTLGHESVCVSAATTIRRLAALLEQREEALRWYAERRNYVSAAGRNDPHDALMSRDAYDGGGPGARARAALAATAAKGER